MPGQSADAETMKAELLAAIQGLKGSRLGKRHGQTVLSTLPWYMVIGPAGAGKSALVARSGLHFPLLDERRNPKAVRGVGGTRSFVWWLSEEAVILDMAGRTLGTAARDDSDDWIAFLEVLKRQRKRDPINGVLVALSVDQVAGPEAKLDTIARGARERVRELIRHLGVVFPVYIVVTQSDRIAGFAEFFGDLPAGERRQVWGATLAVDAHAADEADRALDAEFGQLVAALSDVRLERLAAVPDPAQRAGIRLPAPARACASRIAPLRADPVRARAGEREAPIFRGFYFTSAQQEGEPVDRVLQPVVAELGGAAARAVAPPQVGNGAFFVSEMMTEVVFPDASLVTESTRASTGRRRRDLLVLGGLGILLVAFTILFSTLSCANGRLIDRARRAAREAADQVHPGGQLMPNLTVLEELRKRDGDPRLARAPQAVLAPRGRLRRRCGARPGHAALRREVARGADRAGRQGDGGGSDAAHQHRRGRLHRLLFPVPRLAAAHRSAPDHGGRRADPDP